MVRNSVNDGTPFHLWHTTPPVAATGDVSRGILVYKVPEGFYLKLDQIFFYNATGGVAPSWLFVIPKGFTFKMGGGFVQPGTGMGLPIWPLTSVDNAAHAVNQGFLSRKNYLIHPGASLYISSNGGAPAVNSLTCSVSGVLYSVDKMPWWKQKAEITKVAPGVLRYGTNVAGGTPIAGFFRGPDLVGTGQQIEIFKVPMDSYLDLDQCWLFNGDTATHCWVDYLPHGFPSALYQLPGSTMNMPTFPVVWLNNAALTANQSILGAKNFIVPPGASLRWCRDAITVTVQRAYVSFYGILYPR